jgi:pyruvate/oxaloacetate carboxyltransferase
MRCSCRDEVNAKVDNGLLRNALNRSHAITVRAEDSMVRQACDRRSLRGRFVESGEVRDALSYAGWSQNHIDFLLYRSQHEHEAENQ